MTQHTPGPWAIKHACENPENWAYITANGEIIAGTHNANLSPEDLANAHLIAAAPDMLAALDAMIDNFEELESENSTSFNIARAAIAKARGLS